MRLGYRDSSWEQAGSNASFNEAEAHAPRILCPAMSLMAPEGGLQ